MPQQKSSRPVVPISKMARRLQTVAWLIAIAVVLGVAAFYSRGIGATYAQSKAVGAARHWKYSPAIWWLKWAQWLDPDNPESYLLEARCRRVLGRLDLWQRNLRTARAKGIAPEWITIENQMNAITSGKLPDNIDPLRTRLVQAGYSNEEISTALVRGYLAIRQADKARLLLEQWESADPGTPQLDFAWGFFLIRQHAQDDAEKRLWSALKKQPDHELARMLIAEMYDTQKRLRESLE